MSPHFRGSQPPSSHILPGAPGVPTHPPYPGVMELVVPPPLIPNIFLAETIAAIRGESASQARLINDQYSSVARGYTEMNSRFDLHVRQTDRILAEQHARFEQILDGVRNDTQRFCENQTAAIGDLGRRLSALEGETEASREALASKIAAIAEAVGNGFNRLAVVIGENKYNTQDQVPLENETSADGPSVEAFPTLLTTHEDPSTRDAGCESRPDTDEADDAPAAVTHSHTGFEEDASGPQEQQRVESPGIMIPPSTPTGYDFEVDQAPSTPAAEDVFDTASPLTPMSSSQERDTPGSPIESPEDMLPASHTAPQNATRRKRKRTLSKANGARNSRRKREPQSQDIPRLAASTEDTHVDPSIWPPVIGDIAENRMYIECDVCAKCFHHICVGLERDSENGTSWTCPLCIQDPTRGAAPLIHEQVKKCSRPECNTSSDGEYFMDRLMGRCYVDGVIKYLVSYEYYGLKDCTWEPPENFSNDTKKIEELWECWSRENPGVDHRSLNPRDTVLLHEVYVLARDHKQRWPGDHKQT